MKASKENTFIGNAMCTLLVMQVEDLPNPMSMSWRDGYGKRPRLWVQVAEEHFRSWVDQLREPELSTDDGLDHDIHLHAEGVLRDAPTALIHLVTVTTTPLEV